MTPPDALAEADILALARLLGLPLDPQHLPGVAANLRLAGGMARLLESLPLAPSDEPAPVFRAGRAAP